MRRPLLSGLLLSLGLGCASSRIPNTDVPDTSENRDIIAFCERYRRAVIGYVQGVVAAPLLAFLPVK